MKGMGMGGGREAQNIFSNPYLMEWMKTRINIMNHGGNKN